uniref:Reverse transcriptase domain-containing protein n=1 Tax=Xiphophorus maculatus TaxID=8083 RepID=A0A3B5QGF3_XIPMA
MWQGLQILTDYKNPNTTPASTDVSFLNELNNFYARFERGNTTTATKAATTPGQQPLTFLPTDVGAALSRIKSHKAAGPDGIPGRVLRTCSGELAGVLTDIFNLSLAHAVVPTCFKSTSIVPIRKNPNPTRLNDYRPVALTPIITKCLERLVLAHLRSCLSPTLDPHQFAYRQNRSTEDAVSIALHSVLSYLDSKNTYARLLFLDFSSAFNTVIPSQLITKLTDLGISPLMCNWLLDFLTSRPQHVRLDNHFSYTIIINTGVPQGCVMSPFLYSLFTYDCRPVHGSNAIIKFADDTTLIGLIRDNDEAAYKEEVDRLAEWCDKNNLQLNTEKTKELIVDFRRNADPHPPIHIKGTVVERVDTFKFLGVHISEDLTWTTSCSKLIKKAHQRLFFMRTLRKNHLSSEILTNFFHCTIESILTNCITAWYGNCSVSDRQALQRVVKTAQYIARAPLPAIKDIYRKQCLKRAGKITKDSTHPAHTLFSLLPSGRRYRSLRTRTTRHRNSFFPTAVTRLNAP